MTDSCSPKLGQKITQFVKPRRLVERVFIHCTASSNTEVDAYTVDSWHRGNGWSCIGYHYLCKTDGTMQYGRDLERTPAAQSGHNTSTIAICLNGLKNSDFTETQYSALKKLCSEINQIYNGHITFHGHNEVAAKDCPVFDYRSILMLDSQGYMISQTSQPPLLESHKMRIVRVTVSRYENNRHFDVKIAQGLLYSHGFGHVVGSVDGVAGAMFEQAVMDFQGRNGMTRTGICDPVTWELLEDAGN